MSAPQNFRTQFNGFHREDVVHYLEYLNSKHHAQVNQLTGEADYLRHQLEQYQQSSTDTEEVEALKARCAGMEAELEESMSIRKALEARCNGLQRELDEALEKLQQNQTSHCHVEQELEAYRRAERMERVARERAEQIYHRTNGVLADATARVDAVADELGTMADTVLSQLEQLKTAVGSSKEALKAAADTMYTIRPEEN